VSSDRIRGSATSVKGISDAPALRYTSISSRRAQPRSPGSVGPRGAPRRQPIAATVLLDVHHLLAEMAARGITGRDLAKEAGISEGTIYNALGKRPILVRNAKLIAGALQRLEVDPGLARLVLELEASSVQLLPGRGGQPRGVEVDVALDHAHG
jgi:lambda repressor-like predicted transcriptional regulator